MNLDTLDNQAVHVAFGRSNLTDEYNRHMAVAMVSCIKNCSLPIVIHLFYDDVCSSENIQILDENISYLSDLITGIGAKILFHPINCPDFISQVPNIDLITSGTLMRVLFLDSVNDLNKIIFLDCDMIVNTDVSVLWNLDLNGSVIGAVQEVFKPKITSRLMKKRYANAGIDIHNYFNAGLLVIDLELLRNSGISLIAETKMFFENKKNNLPAMDQEIYNYLFQKSFTRLPEKYNLLVNLNRNFESDDCIIHYAGGDKPWDKHAVSKYDLLYWKYLYYTKWGKDEKLLYYLSFAQDISKNCQLNLLSDPSALVSALSLKKQIQYMYKLSLIFCIRLFIRDCQRVIMRLKK